MTQKEKIKKIEKKKLINSFKYAFHGIYYSATREQNMVIHIIIASLVIIAGILFNISNTEWLIIVITIANVIGCEIINTSIEALTDLVTDEYKELARVAKDTSAGAVLVFAIASVVIGLIIFIPYIIELF